MAVSNGQLANQTTFNNAFMSRTSNTTTTGTVGLNNADAASGTAVSNAQREHNAAASFMGMTLNSAKDVLPSWASSNLGTSSDNLQARVEAIDAQFPISIEDVIEINKFWAEWQETTFDSAAGTEDDISASMAGKVAGGGDAAEGVPTTDPNNIVALYSKDTGEEIEDAGGQRVYGRITEAAGVWTLTYYTNEAGVETAHSLSSQNIRIVFREVFNSADRPTFGSYMGMLASFDATADIAPASATVAGKVTTSAQTFGGDKTFNDFIEGLSEWYGDMEDDAATTGSAQTMGTPAKLAKSVSNISLTSLAGITAPTKEQFFILINKTGAAITIVDEDTGATAANRFMTGTGTDLSLEDDASLWLLYDMAEARWRVVGGSGSGSGGAREIGNVYMEPGDPGPESLYTSGIKVWRFTDGITQRIIGGFRLPPNLLAGTRFFLHFSAQGSAGSGNVLWKADVKGFQAGASSIGTPFVSETFSTTSNQGAAGADTLGFSNVALADVNGQIGLYGIEGLDFLTFEFYRDGGDAADTYAADVDVVAMSLEILESLP